jgi:hypothetical protein
MACLIREPAYQRGAREIGDGMREKGGIVGVFEASTSPLKQ